MADATDLKSVEVKPRSGSSPLGGMAVERRNKMFQVYDNDRLADHTKCTVCSSWYQPICNTFEEAQEYAKKWLGANLESLCPNEPNKSVDYSGYGDMIEIREIK